MEKAANQKNADHTPLSGGDGEAGNITFIGVSEATQNVRRLVDQFANDPLREPILITGERGTGKELVARMIHQSSSSIKNKEVFVLADCGTFHREICHSILFGHLKGSYTDAHKDHTGFFAEATEGTIFVDEIGNLIRPIQPLMLRVIQNKTFRKLGAEEDETTQARMIFATNINLDELYASNDFMDDLLDRMNRRHIHIPPLRERKEDIRVLADHFAAHYTKAFELGSKIKINSDVYRLLENYDFPGNVRQLDTFFNSALLNLYFSKEKVLTCGHFQLPAKSATHKEVKPDQTEKDYHDFLVGYVDDIVEQNRHKWDGLPASKVKRLLDLDLCFSDIALSVLKKTRNKKTVAAILVGLSVERYRNDKQNGCKNQKLGYVKHFRRKKT